MVLFRNRKILMLEPTSSYAHLYSSILEKGGFEITVVDDEETFFEMLKPNQFNLVIIDPAIRGNEGDQVMRKVSGYFPPERTLIFSTMTIPDWVNTAKQLKMADFFTKGQVPPNKLIARVEEIMALAEGKVSDDYFSIALKRDALDADKLSIAYGLEHLKCKTCKADVVLFLKTEQHKDGSQFAARLACPVCNNEPRSAGKK